MPGESLPGRCHSNHRDGENSPPCRGLRVNGFRTMKFLIAGAGAIGAYIGARMSQAGVDVTLFARGPHRLAMQRDGVQVKSAEGDFVARPKIAASLDEAGPVDVIFLGVKAHGLPQLAPHLRPVLGPETTVVSTQNEIPWWYFQGFGGDLEGLRLERIDRGGVISSAIG